MKFTYSSGHRPLEGYTLKRGIGKGGFGEVYYAISDGGKEVALKLVRDHQEVELRGVAQCLNLKHPNLVDLYDLRTDARGDHWVVMEYVSGESMSTVLSRHPEGLPIELAREWFLALSRAINYLHDQGIVHRDLKPGNIFLENGSVKVGDYGLSKAITTSQRTAQTQSIGTVHYMAPEISTGNYNKQIDTYAAGIILYEMLTGHVPFDGESSGEILMKHLTSPPEMKKVPQAFVHVLTKALSKNPVHRFSSMAEFARAVEEAGQEKAPKAAKADAKDTKEVPIKPGFAKVVEVGSVPPQQTLGGMVGELTGSMLLSTLFAAIGTAMWAALVYRDAVGGHLADLRVVFFLTVAASWLILIPTKFWGRVTDDTWGRRIVLMVLGCFVGLLALWLEGTTWQSLWSAPGEDLFGTSVMAPSLSLAGAICFFAVCFFSLRWWKSTDRTRSQRFSFVPIIASSFLAVLLMIPLLWPWTHGAVVMVMTSVIVQLASPWDAPKPRSDRPVRLRYA